ncbi:MAG TPA: guanylate kinase [Acidimicrobiales bacterium]
MLVGPGGAGKGTVAERLSSVVPRLWLSRSWTTRDRRPGEDPKAYVFVDRPTFERRAREGGFWEWAEFLGNLYGTPVPRPPEGHDVLLEIDVQGARQVLERRPDATVVLLVAPSAAAQRARLEARGDDPEHVRRRLERAEEEIRVGRLLSQGAEVVNTDVQGAVDRVAGIVEATRAARRAPVTSGDDPEDT